MQTGINQTSHFIKKDIIMRAYSQLREFLCPGFFQFCQMLTQKQGRRRPQKEISWLLLDCAENQASQVLELVFKYYMSKGEHQKEAQHCNEKCKWTQINGKFAVILTSFNLPKPCLYCSSFPISPQCRCLQEQEGCSSHSSFLEMEESLRISTCSIVPPPPPPADLFLNWKF